MTPAVEFPKWEALGETVAELGEVPIFDPASRALYWIDVFGARLHRTDWSTGDNSSWRLPELVGSYALYEDGRRALVALDSGLAELDLETSQLTPLANAPYDREHARFNDGRCDPLGNFWVGTIRLPGSDRPNGEGHFYKYSRGELTKEVHGVTVANGIAFSPDARTMYLADRPNARILSYSFDTATATATDAAVFISLDSHSVPDGAAVDRDGGYWIAMFNEGEVRRYTPDGRLDRTLRLPTSRPTMCAFAGPDLETLVVTTAKWQLTSDQLDAQPLAGRVLRARVGATGIPEPRFIESN